MDGALRVEYDLYFKERKNETAKGTRALNGDCYKSRDPLRNWGLNIALEWNRTFQRKLIKNPVRKREDRAIYQAAASGRTLFKGNDIPGRLEKRGKRRPR